jgi:pimeloyl-ACP methyl ester carboxylesterase
MVYLASHGYRCIAHDRRGHGRSSQPRGGNEMDTYADDLLGFIKSETESSSVIWELLRQDGGVHSCRP